MPPVTIGWLIALLVLVVDVVLWVAGHPIDANVVYGSACALALARLLP